MSNCTHGAIAVRTPPGPREAANRRTGSPWGTNQLPHVKSAMSDRVATRRLPTPGNPMTKERAMTLKTNCSAPAAALLLVDRTRRSRFRRLRETELQRRAPGRARHIRSRSPSGAGETRAMPEAAAGSWCRGRASAAARATRAADYLAMGGRCRAWTGRGRSAVPSTTSSGLRRLWYSDDGYPTGRRPTSTRTRASGIGIRLAAAGRAGRRRRQLGRVRPTVGWAGTSARCRRSAGDVSGFAGPPANWQRPARHRLQAHAVGGSGFRRPRRRR